MNSLFLPILIVLVSSLIQGTWGLGIRRSAPLSWEAFWAPFSFFAMIVFPVLWAITVIPDVHGYLFEAEFQYVFRPFLFGMLWGVGAIAFGLAVVSIGMSLTYGINMGIGAAVGALVPFFLLSDLPGKMISLVLTGTVIVMVGVYVNTRAGLNREQIHEQANGAKPGNMRKGIILSIIAGLSTAAFNIGFNSSMPLIKIVEADGIAIHNASMIAWLLVLSGGFLMNFVYSVILLIRNGTYRDYAKKGAGTGIMVMFISAIGFFAAIGIYGQGAALMGTLGPVIGWIIFNAFALIVSNFWGIRTGEWKGAESELKRLYLGNAVLVVSWIVLALANIV